MAIDGYTEEQYVQLAREVCVVPELTLGAKHSLDQGNSEVRVINSKSKGYLLTRSDRTIQMPRTNRPVSSRRSGSEGVRGLTAWSPGPSLVEQVGFTAPAPLIYTSPDLRQRK